jgi:hypothetical protein
VVVVVDPAQVVKTQVAGEGRRFRSDTLHQAAISANGVDTVGENVEIWTIITAGEPFLTDRHAHAGSDPLAQRARRGLDT